MSGAVLEICKYKVNCISMYHKNALINIPCYNMMIQGVAKLFKGFYILIYFFLSYEILNILFSNWGKLIYERNDLRCTNR